LFNELDIIVAGVEVLIGEVEADPRCAPLGVEEEGPNLIQADESEAVAAVMTRCGGFPTLLRLRDQSFENVGV
jgi:hypothetical protein